MVAGSNRTDVLKHCCTNVLVEFCILLKNYTEKYTKVMLNQFHLHHRPL